MNTIMHYYIYYYMITDMTMVITVVCLFNPTEYYGQIK